MERETHSKILCIEDEQLLLNDLSEELQDSGYEVVTAGNGKEAIEVLKNETVDLILCDIMMPQIDGPTTLKLVRELLPQHDQVPFIFLTAKATREDILAGKKLGVDDYLTKPVDYDLLLATLEARLSQMDRIKKTNEENLKRLENSVRERQMSHSQISVVLVARSQDYMKPIKKALDDLGCIVEFVNEAELSTRRDVIERHDLCFLTYSKIVHYYIATLIANKSDQGRGKTILLCPSTVEASLKKTMLSQGIGRTIDYPFPPVEIFKVILDAMKTKQAA